MRNKKADTVTYGTRWITGFKAITAHSVQGKLIHIKRFFDTRYNATTEKSQKSAVR